MTATAQLPTWARWTASEPYSLGLEEEVMLLRPDDWTLAQAADALHASLPAELAAQASTETHNSALEIAGAPHRTVGAAVGEIAGLRARLGQALAARGLSGAVAGTHPWATWQDVEISAGERYAEVYRTMRELARREPTFALHVHVGVPDPERAVTLLRALRGHLPPLLALSANSPFWRGQDSGMASVRTSIFRMFPRVGIPRPFRSYGDYVGAVDAMIRCGAIPEPTFLWWDVRLQPRLGTVEVRVMDAQSSCWQTAALAALVQSVAHMELEGDSPGGEDPAPELLDENVFLAARDGLEARLVSPLQSRPEPIGRVIDALLDRLAPHAAELGCARELAAVEELVRRGGGARSQRRIVEQRGPDALLPMLAGCFTAG